MDMDEKIKYAIEKTVLIKNPEKLLSTYEATTVHYFMLSVPFYIEFEGKDPGSETVIREGKITWQKPKLITPSYILRMEGFSDEAKQAFHMLASENADLALMFYKLKFIKDYDHMEIVSNSLEEVSKKINKDIDTRKDPFCAIISGLDEYWDVSLMKFIYELASTSAQFSQFPDLTRKNLLNLNSLGMTVVSKDRRSGIPLVAKNEIENLFELYEKGEIEAKKLKEEIDSWGLFDYYQDRFFNLFKKR
jgi:hypothetical protein